MTQLCGQFTKRRVAITAAQVTPQHRRHWTERQDGRQHWTDAKEVPGASPNRAGQIKARPIECLAEGPRGRSAASALMLQQQAVHRRGGHGEADPDPEGQAGLPLIV
jgi:hypothetical protein